MTRTNWRNLSLLPWLILPVMLLRYWQLQDALPQRIAVHFNLNNVPNGWSERGDFVFGFLGMTVGMLAIFTVLSFLPKRPRGFASGLLVIEYAVAAVMCMAFVGVLEFNALNRANVLHIAGRVAMITPVVAIVAIVISLATSGREMQAALPSSTTASAPAIPPSQGRLLAEETQRAPLAGLLFVLATLAMITGALKIPDSSPVWPKALLFLLAAVMVWLAFHAFGGFCYRVTTTGVEVRTGGIRVCSIAKVEIEDYRVKHVDPLSDFGGWGIRMVPGKRAFIWHGHEAVCIRTPRRTVYLGHDQPERLVKDLDVMMKSA